MSHPQATLPTFLLQPPIGCRKGRRWRALREEGIQRLCQGRWHSRRRAQDWSTRRVLHRCPHKNVSSYRGSWAWTPTHHCGWPLSLSSSHPFILGLALPCSPLWILGYRVTQAQVDPAPQSREARDSQMPN